MKFKWKDNSQQETQQEDTGIRNTPQAIFAMECIYNLFGQIKGSMLRLSLAPVNVVICEIVDDAINRQKKNPIEAALYVTSKVNGSNRTLDFYIEFFCAAEYAVRQYRMGVDEDVTSNEMCVLIQKIITDSNGGEKISINTIMAIFASFSDMFDRIRELDKK